MILSKYVSGYKDMAWLLLRLVVGITFVMHGSQKLFGAFNGPGVQGFAGFLGSLGVPAPILFSWIVSLVEFFGGLALILGIFTRLFALLISVDMTVALLLVHVKNGFFAGAGGFELVLLLLASALALATHGAGKWSVEDMMKKELV